MPTAPDDNLLAALLDSWDRGNTILTNLLRSLPAGALEARAMQGSPTIAAQFTHIRDVRLFFVMKAAPEFAPGPLDLFNEEGDAWQAERDPEEIARMLSESARIVRDAVRDRLVTGREMKGANVSYDNPVLLLQHLLWHEGYHTGQMMLALKAFGAPINDERSGPIIWDVWRTETW